VKTKVISWKRYIEDLETLVKKIRESRQKFDLIIGIERGGYIPAVFISHQLEIPFGKVKSNMKILVVDDISDTGKTLDSYTSSIFTSATLYIKEGTKVVPDFYVRKFPKDIWIVYPYEKEN